jgi:hypothetical protein
MARPSPYSEQTRTAIVDAAVGERKSGKSWNDALDAAKKAGYKGKLQYLVKMVRGSGAGGIRTRGRKRGRPAGKPVHRAMNNVRAGGLGSIENIVNSMVEERLKKTINSAVSALEQATRELKRLS